MIYLDNNATTQPTDCVVEAMLPYLTKCYYNASASTAVFTGADKPRCEAAASMARLLNAEEPECFFFTSGATESNNWIFSSLTKGRTVGRVLVSAVEHASVSEPATELARVGFEVVEIPVDGHGVVRLDALIEALSEDVFLVSIMAANNETGVLQPVAEIGRLIRECCPTALFHTDATQAVGKIPVDLQADWQDVDFLSFSAHKFHGPKGIGGLYIRPGFELEPMILGGGQEHGLRSGTTNTPALAGLASAASEARNLTSHAIRDLRDTFETRLQNELPEAVIHSRGVPRLPNTSYFSLPGMLGEETVGALATAGIIVGTGAACSAGAIQSSKTLRSMGVAHDIASGGLRVSLSRYSSMQELIELIVHLKAIRCELSSEQVKVLS
jgi:cysteine desulfurase